tara:strand:+ start:1153 stop:1551 length:399 start_codon:yes stop_codon:yes gene_type:complete
VKKKLYCYAVINFKQAEEVIKISKENNIKPIIFIKHSILNGFGIDWIKAIISLLTKNFPRNSFHLYVDCNRNYGFAIELIKIKINFIKLNTNAIISKKINDIATKNKVLLNPSFNIVDLSNIKNIGKKFKKN